MTDAIFYEKRFFEGSVDFAKEQAEFLANASSEVVAAMEALQNGVDLESLASLLGVKKPTIEDLGIDLLDPQTITSILGISPLDLENLEPGSLIDIANQLGVNIPTPDQIGDILNIEVPTLSDLVSQQLSNLGVPNDFGNFLQTPILSNILGDDLVFDSKFPPVSLQQNYSIVYYSNNSCSNMTNCVRYVNVLGNAYTPVFHEGLIVLAQTGKAPSKIDF